MSVLIGKLLFSTCLPGWEGDILAEKQSHKHKDIHIPQCMEHLQYGQRKDVM